MHLEMQRASLQAEVFSGCSHVALLAQFLAQILQAKERVFNIQQMFCPNTLCI